MKTPRLLPQSARSLFAAAVFLLAATLAHASDTGAVYAMTNSAAGNGIAVFDRAANGTLTFASIVPTGGIGIGDQADGEGLGSQGALILSKDNRWLFAVNAGSGDISVFAVKAHGLVLINRVPSGGPRPISLTIHGHLLYVLNNNRQAGGAGNITGFVVGKNGHLAPLANSTRPLSANDVDAGDVAFSLHGDVLAVTEKATNSLVTYTIDENGLPGAPKATVSDSVFPFALAFGKRDVLVVADDFGDVVGEAAASSYLVSEDGTLTHVTGPLKSTQTASCWVVVTGNGKYAYVANTNVGNITAYSIASDASLHLLNADGIAAIAGGQGSKVRDMAFSEGSRFLYATNSAFGTVSAFRVEQDGRLTALGSVGGFPAPGAGGIAAR